MKKDSFLKGTLIASIAIIVTKILGVLYVIPFYKIIGEDGGVLYSYAYNIYNLFLNISTAGIPIAVSMIISEYLALNKLDAKERSYKLAKQIIISISIVCFLVLFIFAKQFALFFIDGIENASNINDIALSIRAISFSLIIAPFLSAFRGYLQGHKFISPGSISQVYEQVVRIIVVLVGSYLAIKVFNLEVSVGVMIALLGAFIGSVAAYIYLKIKIEKNRKEFPVYKDNKKDKITKKELFTKLFMYCVPLVIISVTNDLYNLIDMKLIIKGLYMIGFSAKSCELIASIIATWAPKICMIVTAISMGLCASLMPYITASYTKKEYKETNKIFNQAISTMLVTCIPMVIGIFILNSEIYTIFYGKSTYGANILKVSAISSLFFGTLTVISTALQGIKKFKLVIISIVTGLVINAILDIPIILLLNKLNLTPYYGTMIATIIGALISISIILIYLRKELKFSYMTIVKNVSKTIIPAIVMTIIVILLQKVLKINILLKTAIIGITGAIIYLAMMYKNKGLEQTFGKEQINRVMKKLHLVK